MSLTKDQQTTVSSAAYATGIPAAFALGIVDKESAGRAFYTVGKVQLPAIRIEGHYVYKRLPKEKQAEAVRLGLAHPRAGKLPNPKTMSARYALLDKIIAFAGAEIAYQSISIGIGQVMGSNHKLIGYASAVAMFQAACKSFDLQVEQMLDFIAANNSGLRYAQDFAYEKFAKFYNGKAAPKSYWIELEAFVNLYRDDFEAPAVPTIPNAVLVRIKALGYDSVMAFQSARGIKVDGIIGPITKDEVDEAEQERAKAVKKEEEPAITVTKAVVGGTVATASTVVAANPDIFSSVTPLIEPVFSGIIKLAPLGLPFVITGAVIVVAAAVFVWVKNRVSK